MSKISQHQCHTDQIITDATLRGVQHISYNKKILELKEDIEQLRALHQKLDIKDNQKALAQISMKLKQMEQQARDWIVEVGYHVHRDYAITILIEEIELGQE